MCKVYISVLKGSDAKERAVGRNILLFVSRCVVPQQGTLFLKESEGGFLSCILPKHVATP
jgi:hypothetical protein